LSYPHHTSTSPLNPSVTHPIHPSFPTRRSSDLIAIFTQGAIRHTGVIPIAGDQITNDIAMALRTPTKDAEEIKRRFGCALKQLADPQQMIDVPGIGERGARQLSRQTLAEVIEPRIEELYSLV